MVLEVHAVVRRLMSPECRVVTPERAAVRTEPLLVSFLDNRDVSVTFSVYVLIYAWMSHTHNPSPKYRLSLALNVCVLASKKKKISNYDLTP